VFISRDVEGWKQLDFHGSTLMKKAGNGSKLRSMLFGRALISSSQFVASVEKFFSLFKMLSESKILKFKN